MFAGTYYFMSYLLPDSCQGKGMQSRKNTGQSKAIGLQVKEVTSFDGWTERTVATN